LRPQFIRKATKSAVKFSALILALFLGSGTAVSSSDALAPRGIAASFRDPAPLVVITVTKEDATLAGVALVP
jgi:hypothetical protein